MPDMEEVNKEVLKDVPKTEEGVENNVLEQVPVQPQQGNKTEDEDLLADIGGQGKEIKEPDPELSEDTANTEEGEEIQLPENMDLFSSNNSQGKEPDPELSEDTANTEEGEEEIQLPENMDLFPSINSQGKKEKEIKEPDSELSEDTANTEERDEEIQLPENMDLFSSTGNQGQKGNNVPSDLGQDDIRQDIRDLGLQVTNENGVLMQEGGEGEKPFDTLNELKAIRDVQPEQKEDQEDQEDVPDSGNTRDEKLDKLRKDVQNARKGNLYTAVVLAKALEKGDPNLLARRNRFTRFFKSSKVNAVADVAADVGKTVGAISGMVGNFDTSYAQSNACAAISLVTNMLGLVTSIRDFVKKIRQFKEIKHEKGKKNEKAFGMIGILCEGFTLITKLCGIGKAIATFAGKGKGVFAQVMTYVTLAGGFAAQLGGMAAAINGMIQAQKKVKQMEMMRDGLSGEVDQIFQKYKAIDEQSSVQQENRVDSSDVDSSDVDSSDVDSSDVDSSDVDSSDVDSFDEESGIDEDGNSTTEQRSQVVRTQQTSVVTRNTQQQGGLQVEGEDAKVNRRRKVLALLEREDLTEDEKDKLIGYLMWSRRIDKVMFNTSDIGLNIFTLLLGMASGVATSIYVSKKSADAQRAVQLFGTAAGGMGVVSTGNKYAKKISEKRESKYDVEGKNLQNMALGDLGELKKDEYGLKGVAASLKNPNKDQKEEAGRVLNKYAAVDKRLQGLGVKYGPLLKASNEKEFNQLLVAGI